MAHNLSKKSDGTYEMAYVGEKPWHGLGQEVPKGCSVDEMQQAAGLDWKAVPAKVQYHNGDGLLLPFDGKVVLYRDDNCQPLGVVSDDYMILQPGDLLEGLRRPVEEGGWYIHTAGSLRGGRKIWAMATHPSLEAKVGKRDRVKANMLAATSLDGSMRTTFKFVSGRVVCENTFNIALLEAGSSVVLSHRGTFDPSHLTESIEVAIDSFQAMIETANEMAERAVGTDEAMHVLRALFGQPTEKDISPSAPDFGFQRLMSQFTTAADGKRLREQRSVTRALALFGGEGLGSQLPEAKGTAWGLLNAVTQHVDHERGRTPDTRMESAWFGEGERIKGAAFDMIAEAL